MHDGAFIASAGSNPNVSWRDGVFPSCTGSGATSTPPLDLMVIATSPASMGVQVYLGSGSVTRSGQGPYVFYSNTTGTLTLAAANATNPRIDLVYVQIQDAVLGDAATQAVLGVVTGTAAPSPTVPALPANSIPLAQIAVAANATTITATNITDMRKSACTLGGVRYLLPGDSIWDPGYRVGELRSRFLSSYGNVLSIEAWGTDAAWHGTRHFKLNTTSFALSVPIGTTVTLASITIPDPAWWYRLELSAALDTYQNQAGAFLTCNVQLDSQTWATNVLAPFCAFNPGAANIKTYGILSQFLTPNTYSGGHTVYLVAQATGIAANLVSGFNTFTATVVPV